MTAALPPGPADVLTRLEELHKAATVIGVVSEEEHRERLEAEWALLQGFPALLAAVRGVLALAEELEAWRANAVRYAERHEVGSLPEERSMARALAYERAITRIRAVAAALGETGGGK